MSLRPKALVSGLVLVPAALVALPQIAGASLPVAPPSAAVAQADATEASLVANEDARLINVRSAGALARAQHSTLVDSPYRLHTGTSYTLVLTPRSAPYTAADLLQLAPQTFVQSDGAYLLSENLYVEQGATLQLIAKDGPLRLRLQSSSTGFVTIVSFGGVLDFEGTATAPVDIQSYDPSTGSPDQVVADGRSYIRSIGGSAVLSYVHAADLGFWSGRTGGVAITGNDRPRVGVLGAATTTKTYGANHHLGHYSLKGGSAAPVTPAPTTPTTVAATPAGNGTIQPAGPLNPSSASTSTASPYQYVGGSVRNSTFDQDAFGLFLSGAKNFVITDSSFTHSLYSGLVVHRYVTGALLQRDTASDNHVDGFEVTRAANSVQMIGDTASHNGAIGFSINGNPLATVESAAGMALTAYGNHTIANSTASGNGTVGIEINGALNTTAQSDTVNGSPMGIVVVGAARNARIIANTLDHLGKHGISLRDGVTGAVVEGNVVDHSGTGLYVRNSVATVSHNSVDGGAEHGISLVNAVGSTSVTYNTVKGIGAGAIDTFRVKGSALTVANNDTSGWVDLRTWTRHLKQLLSPLTVLWLVILLLIAITALRGRRQRSASGHPYANSLRLSAVLDGGPDAAEIVPSLAAAASSPAVDTRDRAEYTVRRVRVSRAKGAIASALVSSTPNGMA